MYSRWKSWALCDMTSGKIVPVAFQLRCADFDLAMLITDSVMTKTQRVTFGTGL